MKKKLALLLGCCTGMMLTANDFKDVMYNEIQMKEAETPFFKLVVNPIGGRVQNLFFKPAGIQMTDTAKGSGAENVWNFTDSRFFLKNKPYALTINKEKDTFSFTASANHAGGGINFLKVNKTYRFPVNEAKIIIHYNFENLPAAMTAIPYGFWFHHELGVYGGDTRYYYPTEKGIRTITEKKGDLRVFNPSRGWTGVVGKDGRGVAFTMSYSELRCFCTWFPQVKIPTMEWQFEQVSIPEGKSFETVAEIVPFSGLKKISGAGSGLVGEIDAAEEAKGNTKVPVQVKVYSASAGNVEAELFARVAPKGKWVSVKKQKLHFQKPCEVNSFQAEVSSEKDTLLELETILRKNGKEAARLNAAVNFDDCEVEWSIVPIEKKKSYSAAKVDLLKFKNVTPGVCIPWAKPLAGGKLKVLALVDSSNISEVSRLSLRLDMDYTVPFLSNNLLYKLGDYYGYLGQNDVSRNLDTALQKSYDVILISGTAWNKLNGGQKKKILQKVSSGTGLVYVGARNTGKDFPFLTASIKVKKIAAEPRAVDKNLPLLSGIPLDMLGKEPVFSYKIPQGKILVKAGDAPYLTETTHGKGKVFLLNYEADFNFKRNIGSLTPNLKNEYPDRGVPFEFYFLMLEKCMQASANRISAVEIAPVFGDNQVTFNVKSVKECFVKWEIFTLDRFLKKCDSVSKAKQLAAGNSQIQFSLPLRTATGKQVLCAILRDEKGAVLNSGAWSFEKQSQAAIRQHKLSANSADDGQTITSTTILSGNLENAVLTLELEDSFGRILFSKNIPAAKSVTEKIPVKNELPSRFCRLCATLCIAGNPVDRRYANLTVRPSNRSMVWDDFEVGTWINDSSRFYLWNEQAKILRKTGFHTLISNWPTMSQQFAIRYNFNPTTFAKGMGYDRQPEPPDYAKTGNKHVLVKKNCLSNPDFLEKSEKNFGICGKQNRKFGLRFYWMGDEPTLTGYNGVPTDFCFSPHCLREFRIFLKERYGTLEKLNQQWCTSFPSWDAVEPFTKEEVQGKLPQCVAGWADHLEFMDGRVENCGHRFFAQVRKYDPDARTSISGTQPPTAYGGTDWSKLMKIFNGLMSYREGGQLEIQRSFRPEGEFMPWEFGYSEKGAILGTKIFRILFIGYKGIMGFCFPSLINPDWTLSTPMRDAMPHLQSIAYGTGKYYLNNLKPVARVAVLYSQASLRAAFFEKSKPRIGEHFVKYNALLRHCGIAFNYISSEQLEQGILKDYDRLLLPACTALSDREVNSILAFAKCGGKIWAEGVPGKRNFNCTIRKNNPLIALCKQPGNRLFKTLDLSYNVWMGLPEKSEYATAMLKAQQELRNFVGGTFLLADCKGKPVLDAEIYTRTGMHGEKSFGIITAAAKNREVRFQFPVTGYIYEVISGKYYGKGNSVKRYFSAAQPALFVVAPQPFSAPIVKISGDTIDIRSKSLNDTIYRVELIAPDGKTVDYYEKKLIAKNGKVQYTVPFALSDAKGVYQVKVTELVTRSQVTGTLKR